MVFRKWSLAKGGLCAGAAIAALLWTPAAFAQTVSPTAYQALEWRLVGPFRGGRVTAVAGHPAEPTTFYLGATGGGLWRTTDAGTTWKNLSDEYFHTTTIGAIAVAPSDPNVLYVGTGEAPVRGVAAASGDGLYRSNDGGRTWIYLGLPYSRQISRIIVDPANPNRVFAAVQGDPWKASEDRGVYRSDDGGATWKRLLYVDPTTGPSDLSMDAHDPKILYAAMWDHQRTPWNVRSGGPHSGIWKSTDGGDHWTQLSAGLPKLMGRIGVAVSPADSKRLYAMIEAEHGGVYRSDDAGATWTHVNADQGIRDRGWYYSHVFADPKNRDKVYVLAASMVVSADAGKSFAPVREPHGDNHALWINPDKPEVMVEGNDGGGIVSLDGGRSWSSEMNQPTGQFYRIETDDVWPYRIYSAQQDRSSFRIPSMTTHGGIGPQDWADVGGGESSYVAMDRKHPRYVYATALLGGLTEFDSEAGAVRSIDPYPIFQGFTRPSDLKWRFNWNAPVRVSQQDPNVIYHGANVVLKSEDRGQTWTAISPDLTRARPATLGTIGGPIMLEGAGGETYATLTDIVVSPHDSKVIWTGSDDGLVHVTRDGGKSWQDVTPKGLPEADINAIEVSPHDPASAYIAAYRYKLGDNSPYAYKTSDFGKTWTEIVSGFPSNEFVEVVREDPERKGLLYAGSGWGAYVSFDDGAHWRPLQMNLPVAPVTDLQVHGDELVASTQGRAIWILDGLEALRAVTPDTVAEPMHFFAPAPALRLERVQPAAGIDAPNPAYGATFYYSLAGTPAGEVTMDVIGPNGAVVQHFSSRSQAIALGDSTVKGTEVSAPPQPLPLRTGLNRYAWDLRYPPFVPVSDTIRFVSYRPPRVGPGVYTVRLTVDGKTSEQKLQVLPHPGLAPMSDADWAEQQHVTKQLYDLVNDIHYETDMIRKKQADMIKDNGDKTLIAKLEAWQDQVPQAPLAGGVVDKVGYPSRLLSTQVLYTLSIVDDAQPVSAAAKARTAELEAQWAKIKVEGDKLLKE
ncbi:MAG TPA: hypothetical protein VG407_08985 [Caulobacteraceae bacterium]|jgi:photosystem II stability/assembly factor-like uncharacterized protein|nr:hypothetical protein [Caulobacteraceae bacterium]